MASSTRDESLKNIVTALRDKEIVPSVFTDDAQKVLSTLSPEAIMNAIKNNDDEALAPFVRNKSLLKATLAKLDQEQLQTQIQNMLHERRRN